MLSVESYQTAAMLPRSSLVLNSLEEALINAIDAGSYNYALTPSTISNNEVRSLLPKSETPRVVIKSDRPVHTRQPSNPFEVLFEPNHPVTHQHSPEYLSPAYLEIERNMNKAITSSYSRLPIVTVIDETNLKRTGSVVSKNASIRHRNNIKKRNKMGKSDNKSRFLFPVNRKTSLKRRSLAKFRSKSELDEFYRANNVDMLLRELLPKSMLMYDAKGLVKVNPSLKATKKVLQLSRSLSFNYVDPKSVIGSPLRDTFVKNPRPLSTAPLRLDDMMYERYRDSIFLGKFKLPPRFEDLNPSEVEKGFLTLEEANDFNRKLLFEVLLRRTVAAKIEFRLRRSGLYKPPSLDSDTADSGSSNHSSLDSLPRLDSSSSPSDEDSINTDDLMQQNASLFSELLPSPQISYTSDIFGVDQFDRRFNTNASNKSPRQQSSSVYLSVRKAPSLPKDNSSLKYLDEIQAPSYINDFNKSYYAHYNKLDKVEQQLLNSSVYQLKPMSRSNATLLSEEMSRYDSTPLESDRRNTDTTLGSTMDDGKRGSRSTTSTSIFQGLEDLKSELSNFISDNENPAITILPSDDEVNTHAVVSSIPQKSTALDIKSLKGSIIGSLTASNTSHGAVPLQSLAVIEELVPNRTIPEEFDPQHHHSHSMGQSSAVS